MDNTKEIIRLIEESEELNNYQIMCAIIEHMQGDKVEDKLIVELVEDIVRSEGNEKK